MRIKRPPRSMTLLIVGIACTIRRSSVIFPPSSGTLKSTRINTRLPFTSTSATVFLAMAVFLISLLVSGAGKAGRCYEGQGASQAGSHCGAGGVEFKRHARQRPDQPPERPALQGLSHPPVRRLRDPRERAADGHCRTVERGPSHRVWPRA